MHGPGGGRRLEAGQDGGHLGTLSQSALGLYCSIRRESSQVQPGWWELGCGCSEIEWKKDTCGLLLNTCFLLASCPR